MITNFEIEESIALRFEGKYLDLHNCYDFLGFHAHVGSRQLVLTFVKTNADWVKAEDPQKLLLLHDDVSFIDIKYANEASEFPEDEKCLADVTFFPSAERSTNDKILEQKKPNAGDDIIYTFQSDYYIRIGCKRIELLPEK